MEEQLNTTTTVHEFVAYYRELRPEKFSDSKIEYEIPLTKELFEKQLEILSTKKMQSNFENFIVRCAERLITPNIKPQTGPDGGGDGKVDAETYEVTTDISDKWYVADGGASEKEKWAFAISCKKQWKPKVTTDIEKVANTNRGYTRVLFFSNQFIKSSTRFDIEEDLSNKFNIEVSIFDALWCTNAVFHHGCKDIALDCLNFSDEYKKKREKIGILDKQRQEQLEKIEKNILSYQIKDLDTDYIDELQKACILSRGLDCPHVETEGRFNRALRECERYGTPQQKFNIIYDHACTSLFWFEDIDTMYKDFLILKEFVNKSCSVIRIEKMTNILTNLINAERAGLIDSKKVEPEIKYIKELCNTLEKRGDKPSSLLFLRLYIAEQRLISRLLAKEPINEEIDAIRPLLLEAPSHLEISFEAQYQIITNLNKVIDDNPKYEDFVDELTSIVRKTNSEQAAARIEMDRAMALMEKKRFKQAIRHFSFCIHPFEKEECMEELIKTSGMMGIALYEIGLPFSAMAYLVKSASMLLKTFYTSGNIPHLLMTMLQKLCEIELMLGRFVMYLNWYELMMIVSHNGQFSEEENFKETNMLHDGAWACRFAASDLENPVMSFLPDILERIEMFQSSECLKFYLGYADELDEEVRNIFTQDGWQDKMLNQPVFEQFLCDLNISTNGQAKLQTTVNNCTLYVTYKNSCQNQIVAEIFLGAIESMLATMEIFEVLTITPKVYIEITETTGKSELRLLERSNQYELCINLNYSDKDLWECISMFIASFFSRNSMSKEDLTKILQNKQDGEKLMDRVSNLLQVKQSISNVLGNRFKNKIEDWKKEKDKSYTLRRTSFEYNPKNYSNKRQQNLSFHSINTGMDIWEGAGWSGCGFVFNQLEFKPPIFGLAFENLERGKQIIAEWRAKSEKGEPSVIIYIIRGVDKDNPTSYRVCVAPDVKKEGIIEGRYFASMCRKHTMTPQTNWNLDTFEHLYKQFGGCWFTAFQIDNNKQLLMPENFKDVFKFTTIEFRNAWEIGLDDMATLALNPDDVPFIPEGKKDIAPVLEVMDMFRNLRAN